MNRKRLGRVLELARRRAKIARPMAARNLRVGSSYLGMIESGKRTPSLDLLEAMAKLYAIPIFAITCIASTTEFCPEHFRPALFVARETVRAVMKKHV